MAQVATHEFLYEIYTCCFFTSFEEVVYQKDPHMSRLGFCETCGVVEGQDLQLDIAGCQGFVDAK